MRNTARTPHLLTVDLTRKELAFVLRLCEAGDHKTRSNLIRAALWSYADEFGIEVPEDVFCIRAWGGKRVALDAVKVKATPALSVPTDTPTSPQPEPRYRPKRSHQWRRPIPELMAGARTRRIVDSIGGNTND